MKLRFAAAVLLILAVLAGLAACGSEQVTQDTSPLTMYVGLGNTSQNYYAKLHEAILENTGIDVRYVYNNTLDTTNAMVNRLKNGDLPADIIITAMATEEDIQKECFLDLAAYTGIPDLFTASKMREVSVDGAVYQLPFSSRLIGIQYNKTLMEEMGWSLPACFEDMVELRDMAEEAGYQIAVSGGAATGHGFNYLFHIMGSQFLCSPDGSEWFRQFRAGDASVDEFAAESAYFQRYAEAGLFGSIHSEDWDAKSEFSRERAVFYYNILNDIYSYDGFRFNEDGTLYGAEYGDDGMPVAEKDPNGEAVLYEGEYVWYDPENPELNGLERYSVPGAVVLHDEYGAMPWISENGATNCFTVYDNMFLALDKKLALPEQQDKLAQAVTVLRFMASETATDLFSELYRDGYVAVDDYLIDDTRVYADFEKNVTDGYLIPWYYNEFDNDSIVNVGQKVNDYLSGVEGVGLNEVMEELVLRNDNYLSGTADVLAEVSETLDYADSAMVQAMANGLSCQHVLDDAGIQKTVQVSLMPYTDDIGELPLYTQLAVVQERIYEGDLENAAIRALISVKTCNPVVILMTGAEIQELAKAGYTVDDRTFAYSVAVKSGIELEPGTTYAVAVAPDSLETAVYEDFIADGAVIMDGEEPLCGSTEEGMVLYAGENPVISPDDLIWK